MTYSLEYTNRRTFGGKAVFDICQSRQRILIDSRLGILVSFSHVFHTACLGSKGTGSCVYAFGCLTRARGIVKYFTYVAGRGGIGSRCSFSR